MNLLQIIEWFQSLNTAAMLLIIVFIVWFLLKIARVISRVIAFAFTIVGLAKIYITFF